MCFSMLRTCQDLVGDEVDLVLEHQVVLLPALAPGPRAALHAGVGDLQRLPRLLLRPRCRLLGILIFGPVRTALKHGTVISILRRGVVIRCKSLVIETMCTVVWIQPAGDTNAGEPQAVPLTLG